MFAHPRGWPGVSAFVGYSVYGQASHRTSEAAMPRRAGDPGAAGGPALGAHGVNIGMFVKQFNDKTAAAQGDDDPVVITVYSDRSFEFIIKSPPARCS